MNEKSRAIIFFCIIFCLLLPGINRGLWRPDEPRVAGICAEMARTGDYVVPRLNGSPFLEYPPLYYAVGASFGRILGPASDVPYRLASLLFGVLTLGIIFRLMHLRLGTVGGLLGSGILASSWGFFQVSHGIIVDSALMCGVALAMYAYIRLITDGKPRHAMLFGLALGLSFLVKGLVGPGIIAAAVAADMIRQRSFAFLWRSRPLLVLICAILPAVPWLIGLYHAGGWPFLREVILVNNLMRYTGAPEGAALGHQEGPLFYWNALLHHTLPWTLLLIPAVILSVRRYREDPFLSWIIGPLVLLSISATKRGVYLVPLCPATACMIAEWLLSTARRPWEQWLMRITWGMAILGALAPFAGLGLGHPLLGLVMGLFSLGALVFFVGRRREVPEIRLVFTIGITLCACMTVYYVYAQPTQDFLGIAREAMAKAQGREMTLIGHDESMRGLFSLAEGHTLTIIDQPADAKTLGLYVWGDKSSRTMDILRMMGDPHILMQREADGRKIFLAQMCSNTHPASAVKTAINTLASIRP